jgi:undecaprenyl-diphosphatase
MATPSGFESIVLGAVQGLSEFLPISSSAHLVLIPWLLKWEDPGLAFDVALHLGTLVALIVYYWREWLAMGTSLFNGDRPNRRLLMLLVAASVPGAIIGLLFEKQAETIFRSPLVIAIALGVLGIILWFADHSSPQTRTISEITVGDAILMGFTQAFAIIPGVSRSGSTITMARILRLKREDSANFSFLMAAPIIAGAGLKESGHLLHALDAQVMLGFLAAAIFGLAAIVGLIRYLRVRSYAPFAWYRVAAAVFVIVVFILRG